LRRFRLALAILFSLLLVQFYMLTISYASSGSNTNPNLGTKLWSFSTDGSVYHSAVVTEGYVYVTSSFVTYSRASIYCLNASNGAQIWNHTTPKGNGFTTPIVYGGIVYTNSNSEKAVFAFNASTGSMIWNTTGRISAVAKDIAYVAGDGVLALDAVTGKRIWSYEGPMLSASIVGGYAYIRSSGLVYALDAASGIEKWSLNTTEHIVSLAVVGKYVYVVYRNLDSYGVNVIASGIFALDAATGNQVWEYKTERGVSSPIVAGDIVYVGSGDGNVIALNTSNGTKIWNYTTEGSPSSSVLSDPYLYVSVNSNSEPWKASLYCIDATNGAKVWNFTTEPGNSASSPVVVDGQVLVGNTGPQFFANPDHPVYALNASTGEQIWNYTIKGNADSLTVADGVVYVGATFASTRSATSEGNGAVYALKPPTTTSSDLFLNVILIVAVVLVVILTVVFFIVYWIKSKRAKSLPSTTLSSHLSE